MRHVLLVLAALSLPLTAAAAEPPTTRAVKRGYDAGFKDCAGHMDAAVRFVHEDDAAYAHLGTWSKDRPNDEAFNAVTAETYPGATSVASFTGVKSAAGKCDTAFTQVLAIPEKSCETLAKETFKDWKFFGELNGSPVFEDPSSPNVSVILIAMTRSSCVVFKQAMMLGG